MRHGAVLVAAAGIGLVLLAGTSIAQWSHTPFPSNRSVSSIVVSGPRIFAGSHNEGWVLRSTNEGLTWDTAGVNFDVLSLAADGSELYAGTLGPGGGVFVSNDSGGSWQQTGLSSDFVGSLLTRGTEVFATVNGVSVSSDTGKTWTTIDSGLTNSGVICLAMNAATVLAATCDSGVYRSTNDGLLWQHGAPLPHCIYSLTANSSRLFAGTDSGVFASTDNGLTWHTAGNGLAPGLVNALLVVDSSVFAGIFQGGVYRSTDNGLSWQPENTGLGDTVVYALATSDSFLFAGTNTGIWKRKISDLITSVSEPADQHLPSAYRLEQNFPNPFNPVTTIRFVLPHDGRVTLEVFDLLGLKMQTLVNGDLRRAVYEISWDATALPSGAYFYRLQAGSFSDTKKLLLVR